MRFGLAGINHETNTFHSIPTKYENFEKSGMLLRGKEIEKLYDSPSTIGGFYKASQDFDFELIPLMFATTGPLGTITSETFEKLISEILEMIEEKGPFDAVLLNLHGAAVSEEFHDMDGEITRRVRDLIGPEVPFGINLDMHANVSEQMILNTDITNVYQTTPHLDADETGYKCAELVYKTVQKEIFPTQSIETPPMTINIVNHNTNQEPMKSILAESRKLYSDDEVLSVSVAEGYPYSDIKKMGMSFVVITNNNMNKAKEYSKKIAKYAWSKRFEMDSQAPSIEEGLREAVSIREKPVVLMDSGDNIGAGSSADSTHILHKAREIGVSGILQTLYDPEAVEKCMNRIGSMITIKVGGKSDSLHGDPIEISGTVKKYFEGEFEDHGRTHGGTKYFDAGDTVVIETEDENTLILTSKRVGNTSIELYYSLGLNPINYPIIVAKGVQSPRPAFEPIASKIIALDSPGVTASGLHNFNFENRIKPMFPFEKEDALYD
ncbi:MAG: hypothetical protein CL906_01820 [Dehalococcoidia bacterium]|mgnify:FL=1|nr:hypothetical protein [Dehalococcoidia bacterium]|tara:strand:- start:654 stop:2135 length:1482 start_codon:yes stop_codon:yes gene_type:complete